MTRRHDPDTARRLLAALADYVNRDRPTILLEREVGTWRLAGQPWGDLALTVLAADELIRTRPVSRPSRALEVTITAAGWAVLGRTPPS